MGRQDADELLDLEGSEPERFRVPDRGREGRVDAVDVDREIDPIPVYLLEGPVDAGSDPPVMDVVHTHIREAEPLQFLPFFAAIGTYAVADDMLEADVVRDSTSAAAMGPRIVQVGVSEVQVGKYPDQADILGQ